MLSLFGFVVPDWVVLVLGFLWLAATIGGVLFSLAMFFDALPRKLGGRLRKGLWLAAILFVPFFSLFYYLLFRTQLFSKKSFVPRGKKHSK
jgi:hypothetical protein